MLCFGSGNFHLKSPSAPDDPLLLMAWPLVEQLFCGFPLCYNVQEVVPIYINYCIKWVTYCIQEVVTHFIY